MGFSPFAYLTLRYRQAMEMNHDDLPETLEHRGPQVAGAATRWAVAGWIVAAIVIVAMMFCARTAHAQVPPAPPSAHVTLGGFADVAYLFAPNDPYNHDFRSRGTAWHVNDLYLNMAAAYARKAAVETSRWGAEVTVQTGKDDEIFGFSATAPNIAGADWLRHLGPANVIYRADVGKGLMLQGGIFSSLIGYDSLYARDNLNYTRPWGADFTPYLMMGVNANYPLTDRLTGTFFVVNGYWHLANANAVPSSGVQLAFAASPNLTVKETVLAGPHQDATAFGLWRFLSDTIVERKSERFVVALNYDFATEQLADSAVRAWWMAAQVPMQWQLGGPWRVSVRPEVAWDSTGRWTLAEQTVKAITGTLEYRPTRKYGNTSLRLEYRVDNSTGPQGGFYTEREDALTSTQHLLIAAVIVRFDSTR